MIERTTLLRTPRKTTGKGDITDNKVSSSLDALKVMTDLYR